MMSPQEPKSCCLCANPGPPVMPNPQLQPTPNGPAERNR